jgi:hypothetical protein
MIHGIFVLFKRPFLLREHISTAQAIQSRNPRTLIVFVPKAGPTDTFLISTASFLLEMNA